MTPFHFDVMTTKKCTKCGEVKSLSEDFYKSNKTLCKECVKARTRKNRAAKLEYYQAYDRQRGNLPYRIAAREAYKKTDQGKARLAAGAKAWIERNPVKRAAQVKVGNAIALGKLTKQPCEVCGSTKRVNAHHDDYSKPLEVRWLCPKHHSEWHKHNTPVGA